MIRYRDIPKSESLPSALILGILILIPLRSFAQANPPNPPAGVPQQQAIVPPNPLQLAPEEDPNAPGLSRAERIKRQESLIRRQLQAAKERQQLGLPPVRSAPPQAQPTPTPPGTPPPAAGAQPPASDPAAPESVAGANLEKREKLEANVWVADIPVQSVFEENKRGFRQLAFYLKPGSVVATTGDRFVTELRMISTDKTAADRIEIVLKYPPQYVEPISIHQDNIAHLIDGEPQWGIDPDLGEIHYSANFVQPIDALDIRLIDVAWRAIKPAEGVEISLWTGDRYTAAYAGPKMLTGNEFGPKGMLVGSILRVIEQPGVIPAGYRMVNEPLDDYAPALAPLESIQGLAPTLWFDYNRKIEYEPGEWVIVDIYLDNPDERPFDDLRLALHFDPEAIEFIDTDLRNAIRRGENILDGPFKDFWDWDSHYANRIDNAAGLIEYHMGRKALQRQPSGVVARAIGRLKKRAEYPLITWAVNPGEEKTRPTTAISLLGRNLLRQFDDLYILRAAAPAMSGSAALGGKADPSIYRE